MSPNEVVEMKFKDVPIGAEFGFGDYFHWKNTETTAVCDVSSEVHPWDPNITVIVAVAEEEDFLSGVTCNPNAPEECESCQ